MRVRKWTQIKMNAPKVSLNRPQRARAILTHSHRPEPPPGFEPETYALRVRCSTPELRRRINNRSASFSGTAA